MDRIANTLDVLDSIKAIGRRVDIKLDSVKVKAEAIRRGGTIREIQRLAGLPADTNFMAEVSSGQAERKNLLAGKVIETERLRQEVKRKKSSAEREIDILGNELRRARL